MDPLSSILDALAFAAEAHQYQRRNGYRSLPYINHLIKVVSILRDTGGEQDVSLLQAAALHDVVEDSDVNLKQLAVRFSPQVADIVGELTDDMSLPYEERRKRQLSGAAFLSEPAKRIRLVDKGANINDLLQYPIGWTIARKKRYVVNAIEIVSRMGQVSRSLDTWFEDVAAEAKLAFGIGSEPLIMVI